AATLKEQRSKMKEVSCTISPFTRHSSSSSMPHTPVDEGTSLNWSGYAAATSLTKPTTGSVSYVTGTWVVPKLTATPNNSYSAAWVGIDGYSSSTVEQLGSESDWINGKQQNYVWFEMYPQGAYEIVGFPINIGDTMAAEVTYVGRNTFELSIYNITKRSYFVVPSSYTKAANAKRSSAEWIVEAPSEGSSVLPLADFGSIKFSGCQATISGKTGTIGNSSWKDDPLTMATQSGIVKDVPSVLTSNGASFIVTWDHE
ncbi:MAG: hypothetical protein JSR46_08410, partial [Verrucomicrobia bacterium]|nr:hypothetical protein [Verrucomicrobiota bacterium]